MTEALADQARMLKGLTRFDESVRICWIVTDQGMLERARWTGFPGWLRFVSAEQCEIARDLPSGDVGRLLSGEWLEEEGTRTIRAMLGPVGASWRSIAEVPGAIGDALPAIRIDQPVLTDTGTQPHLVVAVYFGFRNDEDFAEGRLSRIAERLVSLEGKYG